MIGSLSVDISQLYHLSTSLGTSAMAMDVNDQRPDAGQVGNSDVQGALDTFFGNWNYKRRDLVDRLKTVSQAIANTATTYGEMENNVKGIFEQILRGMLSSNGGGSSALRVTSTPPSGPLRVTRTPPSGSLHVAPPLPVPNVHVGPVIPSQSPRAAPQLPLPEKPSPYAAEFARTDADLKASFQRDYPKSVWTDKLGNEYDVNGFGYNPGGDCTSYVAWRLNEIAKSQGLAWTFSNGHVGPTVVPKTTNDGRMGNAADWGQGATATGCKPDSTPTVGSVAWWGKDGGLGSAGHVAIVKSVDVRSGAIVVEESSYGSDGTAGAYVFKTATVPLSKDPSGSPQFIHLLPGT